MSPQVWDDFHALLKAGAGSPGGALAPADADRLIDLAPALPSDYRCLIELIVRAHLPDSVLHHRRLEELQNAAIDPRQLAARLRAAVSNPLELTPTLLEVTGMALTWLERHTPAAGAHRLIVDGRVSIGLLAQRLVQADAGQPEAVARLQDLFALHGAPRAAARRVFAEAPWLEQRCLRHRRSKRPAVLATLRRVAVSPAWVPAAVVLLAVAVVGLALTREASDRQTLQAATPEEKPAAPAEPPPAPPAPEFPESIKRDLLSQTVLLVIGDRLGLADAEFGSRVTQLLQPEPSPSPEGEQPADGVKPPSPSMIVYGAGAVHFPPELLAVTPIGAWPPIFQEYPNTRVVAVRVLDQVQQTLTVSIEIYAVYQQANPASAESAPRESLRLMASSCGAISLEMPVTRKTLEVGEALEILRRAGGAGEEPWASQAVALAAALQTPEGYELAAAIALRRAEGRKAETESSQRQADLTLAADLLREAYARGATTRVSLRMLAALQDARRRDVLKRREPWLASDAAFQQFLEAELQGRGFEEVFGWALETLTRPAVEKDAFRTTAAETPGSCENLPG